MLNAQSTYLVSRGQIIDMSGRRVKFLDWERRALISMGIPLAKISHPTKFMQCRREDQLGRELLTAILPGNECPEKANRVNIET